MENINKVSKTILFFLSLSYSLFTGGYFIRHLAVYQLFEENSLRIKDMFLVSDAIGNYFIIFVLVFSNAITYVFFLILFITFLVFSKLNLKVNGWLFISSVIILLTSPFELYLIYWDMEFVGYIINEVTDISLLSSSLIVRYENLSGFPLIHFLSLILIPFLFIFQPFKNIKNLE